MAHTILLKFTDEQWNIIQSYGERRKVLATMGRNPGEVNATAVVRLAVEYLPVIEKLQHSNGGMKQ